jgi:hypothetical protein
MNLASYRRSVGSEWIRRPTCAAKAKSVVVGQILQVTLQISVPSQGLLR